MDAKKFQRLVINDVWNVPVSAPGLDSASIGAQMAEDERLGRAADRKVLEQRRLDNLARWRQEVETGKASGTVFLYPYDKPLKFPERTAYDLPGLPVRQQPQQRNRPAWAAGRVY
jgi:hypothetical protein